MGVGKLIELIDIYKEYPSKERKVVAVSHVNLKINTGEIYGIVGYSGAGKSTLLRTVNLLEKPTSGTVLINGLDLTKLNNKELRLARQKIGMIFQHFNINHNKTIYDNIAFALKAAGKSKEEIKREFQSC